MLLLQLSAFHLLHPTAGLLALLGLLVPLLVYLWNRRPAQVVQVGSLRWLETAANRRLRRLKPEQLLLFLLRAGIVGVLALAVAGLIWQKPAPPVRGQVLLSPALLASPALAAVRPGIDSLRQQGYQLRQLRRGMPQLPARTWARLTTPTPALLDSLASRTPTDNLWMRAQQAADSFPDRPLRVFTTTARRQFRGERPVVLPARLRWQLVPTPDSARWLHAAAWVGSDSLRLLIGRSTEEGNTFRQITVRRPATGAMVRVPGLAGISYQTTATGAHLRTTDSTMIPVRTTPVRVWLLTDASHTAEARYWRAAVKAVAVGLAAPLQLTAAAQPPAGPLPDAIIWLRDAPIPTAWAQELTPGRQVWQVGHGTGRTVNSTFGAGNAQPTVAIRRLDSLSATPAEAVWQTATGQPLLTRQALGSGTLYQLHTRLHPTWSGLGESPALPSLLLPLLQPELAPGRLASHDQRALDPGQLPLSAAPTAAAAPAATDPLLTDLRPWVVLAALLLFGLERALALRTAGRSLTASTAA